MCFDKAPRDEAAPSGAKDSLAHLLHEISVAVHDEEEGDAAEDDMGEAILDDDDDDDNVGRLPLQPHVLEAATICARGCNPTCPQAATLCVPRSISSSVTHARTPWSLTGATTTRTRTSEP